MTAAIAGHAPGDDSVPPTMRGSGVGSCAWAAGCWLDIPASSTISRPRLAISGVMRFMSIASSWRSRLPLPPRSTVGANASMLHERNGTYAHRKVEERSYYGVRAGAGLAGVAEAAASTNGNAVPAPTLSVLTVETNGRRSTTTPSASPQSVSNGPPELPWSASASEIKISRGSGGDGRRLEKTPPVTVRPTVPG